MAAGGEGAGGGGGGRKVRGSVYKRNRGKGYGKGGGGARQQGEQVRATGAEVVQGWVVGGAATSAIGCACACVRTCACSRPG